ncbi:hypothetical protein [Acetobacter vaccinii]|uniref:hypothetical protein n=1 Tax=Acetobacter vaccinii TaxID=2592655 RepID=UPI001FED8EAE|nr:hypothetical protein [Acetobacter vaccinii]
MTSRFLRNSLSIKPRWPLWHCVLLVALPLCVHLPELLGPLLPGHLTSDPRSILSVATTTRRNWLEGGLLPGLPGWVDGCAGVIVQALGRLVARDWMHGILPTWNPYDGVGMPLAGEYQPAAFFMPFVLLLGLPGGLLLFKITLQVLAGLCMYAFLRALALDPRAVLVGALLWAFNGTFAWATDGPIQPLAFAPLALLGVEQLRGRPTGQGWGCLALGLGWLLLAGFPETAFLLGTLVFCWAVMRCVQQPYGTRLGFALRVLAGGCVALLLALPQLVVFFDYLSHAWIGPHAGVMDIPHPMPSWIMSLFPYMHGLAFYGPATLYAAWWGMGGYWGLTLPFLALMAIWGQRDRPARGLLVGYVLACVAKQANMPGVTALLDMVPGIGRTYFHRLCYPAEELAMIVLATFTLDDLCRLPVQGVEKPWWTRGRLSGLALVLLCLGCVCGVLWWWDAPVRTILDGYSHGLLSSMGYRVLSVLIGVVALLGCVLAFVVPGVGARGRMLLAGGSVVGESLVLFCIPLLSLRPALPVDTVLLTTLQREIGLNRFVSLGVLPPNYGAYYGLASINHNGVPMPAAWIARLQRDFGADLDPVTFDGITSTRQGHTFLANALAHPARLEQLGVALAVVPHGTVAEGWQALPVQDRPVLIYSSGANDLYRLAHPAPYFDGGPDCKVTSVGRDTARVLCARPATLIRRELMLPGWTASINGRQVVPGMQDGLFQRLSLPAGQVEVHFAFTPPGLCWGWFGFCAGLLLLAFGFRPHRADGRSALTLAGVYGPAG